MDKAEAKATWLWAVKCSVLGLAYYWVLNHPPGKSRRGPPLVLELPFSANDEEELVILGAVALPEAPASEVGTAA